MKPTCLFAIVLVFFGLQGVPVSAQEACDFWEEGSRAKWRRVAADDVAICLSAGRDPNARNGQLVFWAAEVTRDANVLNLLLEAGGDPNARDGDETALEVAASKLVRDSDKRVAALIEAGADLSGIDQVFLRAALQAPVDTLRLLVDAGANPFARFDFGETALHRAASMGYPETVKYLIDLGLPLNARSNARGFGEEEIGFTPLMAAAWNNRIDLIPILIDAGADVNALSSHQSSSLHIFSRQGAERDERSAEGIQTLLTAGVNPNVHDATGKTPLHYAAALNMPILAKALLDGGADGSLKDQSGNTPWKYIESSVRSGNLTDDAASQVWWRLHDSQF